LSHLEQERRSEGEKSSKTIECAPRKRQSARQDGVGLILIRRLALFIFPGSLRQGSKNARPLRAKGQKSRATGIVVESGKRFCGGHLASTKFSSKLPARVASEIAGYIQHARRATRPTRVRRLASDDEDLRNCASASRSISDKRASLMWKPAFSALVSALGMAACSSGLMTLRFICGRR
jgi:hypothetical protein